MPVLTTTCLITILNKLLEDSVRILTMLRDVAEIVGRIKNSIKVEIYLIKAEGFMVGYEKNLRVVVHEIN